MESAAKLNTENLDVHPIKTGDKSLNTTFRSNFMENTMLDSDIFEFNANFQENRIAHRLKRKMGSYEFANYDMLEKEKIKKLKHEIPVTVKFDNYQIQRRQLRNYQQRSRIPSALRSYRGSNAYSAEIQRHSNRIAFKNSLDSPLPSYPSNEKTLINNFFSEKNNFAIQPPIYYGLTKNEQISNFAIDANITPNFQCYHIPVYQPNNSAQVLFHEEQRRLFYWSQQQGEIASCQRPKEHFEETNATGATKRKSILNSILSLPKFVFKGFK